MERVPGKYKMQCQNANPGKASSRQLLPLALCLYSIPVSIISKSFVFISADNAKKYFENTVQAVHFHLVVFAFHRIVHVASKIVKCVSSLLVLERDVERMNLLDLDDVSRQL